ncbi:MAG: GNAT family N-acetyltransferase [Candidatus Roizmanbacteria bacterium]|nr:GNAT family N-acetyltransferase [Candidatus Roizmanbacteria bacterium]
MKEIKVAMYKASYKDQVGRLVGECLVDQEVIKESDLPIDDDDLQKIPEVYTGNSRFWIALDCDKVVGTVGILDRGENTAKLRRMFVQKEYRGTGLGQKLLDTALCFAKEAGYIRVRLNTHTNMKRAHHFYEKNKFILIGEKGSGCKICYERSL